MQAALEAARSDLDAAAESKRAALEATLLQAEQTFVVQAGGTAGGWYVWRLV